MKKFLWLFLIVLLAACSSDEDAPQEEKTVPPALTPTFEMPTLDSETRQSYEEGFENLRQLHTAMDAVWGALSRGETAQCGTVYTPLSPEEFNDEHPIAQELYTAAVELTEAVRLWEGECQNPRAEIPSDVRDRGLRMVLTAGDALREAEKLLNN